MEGIDLLVKSLYLRKGRKEGRKEGGGRNWWHPCSGTTHLGYEEKLNSYGAASLAESSGKPVDMVLKFICCSFLASMSSCQVVRMTRLHPPSVYVH